MEFIFHPIGVIHTPFQETTNTPIQSSRSDAEGTVEVFPEYAEGLQGVEDFSHLLLLYVWHKSPPCRQLTVQPFLDDAKHGVFATRFPSRPNMLGISVVRLLRREENQLFFSGADMLDNTPLLDIKPYIPEFDIHPADKIGWYGRRAFE